MPTQVKFSPLLKHPYWPRQIQTLLPMLSMSLSLIHSFALFLPSLILTCIAYSCAQIKIICWLK